MSSNNFKLRNGISEEQLVRETECSDGTVFSYQSSEDNVHKVVVQSEQQSSVSSFAVPNIQSEVLLHENMWTIPDNWVKQAESDEFVLFEMPETNQWVKTGRPGDAISDAYYEVKQVGTLQIALDDDDLTSDDLFLDALERREEAEEKLDADFDTLLSEWETVMGNFAEAVKENREKYVKEYLSDTDHVILTDDMSLLIPTIPVENLIQDFLPESIESDAVVDFIIGNKLIPDCLEFDLSIDDHQMDMDYCIRALETVGCTPPEALDFFYTECIGGTTQQRADRRGVNEERVKKNVSQAEQKLSRPKIARGDHQ